MLKPLIANRGEIAVRIIRAARELGIRTVQAHSAADTESLAVKLADEAVNIGPPHAAKSYLNIPAIIDGGDARPAPMPSIRAMASSPRMPSFADAVEKAGLIFVGPERRCHPHHGRQGRGARRRRESRRAGRAGQRRARRRSRAKRRRSPSASAFP